MSTESGGVPEFAVGVVGGRGYVGGELISLIDGHPNLTLGYVASRTRAGRLVDEGRDDGMRFIEASAGTILERDADVVVLAVPDGVAGRYVEGLGSRTVIDLSSDHRFDPAWAYGLPEHQRGRLGGAGRIANPGCYATALQLLARPLLGELTGPIHAFGVSGYSGAGTSPSAKNDPDALRGGVLAYGLVDHKHEREAAHHLAHRVRFSPHVAEHFRGLSVTIQGELATPMGTDDLIGLYESFYADEPFVRVLGAEVPIVGHRVGRFDAAIGGLCVASDGVRVGGVCVLDNLLKGAASQAIQNINLALGLSETAGLDGAGVERREGVAS